MLHKLKNRKQEGFTIIEVLIVLAIAGLILLIVFLAVPALQRNSHNTSIKNDVAGLLGGMSEYVNNNNGSVPASLVNTSTTEVNIGASGTNQANVKLGYLDGSSSSSVTLTAASGAITNSQAPGTVHLYTKAVCNANGIDATNVGATSRNFVALYGLEGGAKICQSS